MAFFDFAFGKPRNSQFLASVRLSNLDPAICMASMLELLLEIENIRKKWKILEIFHFQVASTSDAASS